MPPVKTCPLDPAELVSKFHAAAEAQGFRTELFGESHGVPLHAFTRRAVGTHPRVYISAGVHGDEPAAPYALLDLMKRGFFGPFTTWFLIPMLNPSGFTLAQRENHDGVDLNRDYLLPRSPEVRDHVNWLRRQPRFDLALCLHEDWETHGFYLYELARKSDPAWARRLRAAATEFLPIEQGDIIDGRPIDEPGIIRPESDPDLRELWPEAIYLFKHHTDTCFTLESPSARPLKTRVHALTAAVDSAVAHLSSPPLCQR